MKNTLQNEFSYSLNKIGNMRVAPQPNTPLRKVLKSREDFTRIEQRTLKQTNPINVNDAKVLSLNLKEKLTLDLTAKYQRQFYKTLQDNIEFVQEFESLEKFYKFSEINSIKTFLRKNRFLIPLLREIPEIIYNYFGDDHELALKIAFEYDLSQSSELLILILTKLSVNEAFPILESFDEQWWLENIDRADCKLNISLEYV